MITVSKAFDKSIKTPNKSVMSRMTIPKTKLFVKKKVIIVQVIINSVVHYPLRSFRETRKYGN